MLIRKERNYIFKLLLLFISILLLVSCGKNEEAIEDDLKTDQQTGIDVSEENINHEAKKMVKR